MNLKPYPAMKNAGVEWLGEVPEHWEVRKLRSVLKRVTERNRPDLPLLSVVREKGVILRDVTSKDENRNFIPDDLTNYKVVREGQFAMNKMKAWQGSYGVSRHDGIVSPAYFIFDVHGVDGAYFHSAIRCKAYVPFLTQASDGVRIGQWDLSEARMREIPFSVPPLPEQAAIVRFLDYVDRRVRRYVRAKQKLIGLLEEQKQAIIHRAVTRGLDPDVPLKPSGVQWLGDVPEHWEVMRLVQLLAERIRNGLYKSRDYYGDGGTPMIQMGEAFAEPVIERRATDRVHLTEEERDRWALFTNDLLFARRSIVFEGSGKCSIVGSLAEQHVFESSLIRVRPNTQLIRPRYLFLFLKSWFSRSQILSITKQVTISGIDGQQLKTVTVLVPPLDEQAGIVVTLDKGVSKLDIVIAEIRRGILLLREYRTRLIADVVTGKLDVRGVALDDRDVDDGHDGNGEALYEGAEEEEVLMAAEGPTAYGEAADGEE